MYCNSWVKKHKTMFKRMFMQAKLDYRPNVIFCCSIA